MMEWAIRKKDLSEVFVRAVMSLYHGAKTKVNVGSKICKEFRVEVRVHQQFVLSPQLFVVSIM